jgi:hypothetical protein
MFEWVLTHARAAVAMALNVGWRVLAHVLGFVASWKRVKRLARWYFYAWIFLLFWCVPVGRIPPPVYRPDRSRS